MPAKRYFVFENVRCEVVLDLPLQAIANIDLVYEQLFSTDVLAQGIDHQFHLFMEEGSQSVRLSIDGQQITIESDVALDSRANLARLCGTMDWKWETCT